MSTIEMPYAEALDLFKRLSLTVDKRPHVSVLACALLDGDSIVSTDLESWTVLPLEQDGAKGLAPVLDTLKALKALKEGFPAARQRVETITLAPEAQTVTLSAFGRTVCVEIPYVQNGVGDFPNIPDVSSWNHVATFKSDDLASALTFAAVAAGRDETLPMLTGVRIEGDTSGTVSFAATDRYRLAVTEVDAVVSSEFSGILPARVIPAVAALTGDVRVSLSGSGLDGSLHFTGDGGAVTARLIDAAFPSFRSLIPSTSAASWTVNRKRLAVEIKSASAMLERRTPVRIDFTAEGITPQGGATVPADYNGDSEGLTAFNPAYLLGGLKAFGSDEITIARTAANKPHVLSGQRPDGADGLHLIVPVRLD